ncbi:hypothetical protein [Catellatospora sp. NPDC049609]|uniref:hypothetical protein n=1 Tax=Catellatospora sp. NPDC049609 TaxID=3155505 RepID=UPI0034461893
MRRVLATATLGLALLGMAACADPETPSATASGTPAAGATSAAPAPAASPIDKAAACAAYDKAQAELTKPLMETMMNMDAVAADPAKAQQAIADLTKGLATFGAALAPVAAGSVDPELKAAIEADIAVLNKMPAAIAAAGPDLKKVVDALGTPEFEATGEKVKSLCGK